MSPNIHFNKRDSEVNLNDQRIFSFKFLILIIIFALMILSVVYFYKISAKKEMVNGITLMANDLEDYIQGGDI